MSYVCMFIMVCASLSYYINENRKEKNFRNNNYTVYTCVPDLAW